MGRPMVALAKFFNTKERTIKMDKEEKKEIEIVTGNGDLNISPVEDHVNSLVKKKKMNKDKLVIPHQEEEKKNNK